MDSDDQVSITAYLTALARAEATEDPSSDFNDEFAARFAELCPAWILSITRDTAGRSVTAARTSIIDRMIGEVLERDEIDVCVNLGAGFDSRPFRLDWPPGCRIIEIDKPSVLDVKDRLLPTTASCASVERVRCDVTDLDALVGLLADRIRTGRLLVVSEGLLPYFDQSYVSSLAVQLTRLSTSAWWICDVLSEESASRLSRASRSADVALDMVGMQDLRAFEVNGWLCDALTLLPSAHVPTGRLRSATSATTTTSVVPDCVLKLRAVGSCERSHES